jgi:hypothetical protein
MKTSAGIGLGALGILIGALSCVGDDPATPSGGDAGLDDGGGVEDASVETDAGTEAPLDAGGDAPEGPRCDPSKPFGDPTLMGGLINTPEDEGSFAMSSDELVAVVARAPQFGKMTLHYYRRPTRSAAFVAEPDKVTAVNSASDRQAFPSLGPGALTLFFQRLVNATSLLELRYATRGADNLPFNGDQIVTFAGAAAPQGVTPRISADGLRLYYTDIEGDNLLMMKRAGAAGNFVDPKSVRTFVREPVLSADQLTLYYNDISDGAVMRVSKRADVEAAFPVGDPMDQALADRAHVVHVTEDDCILYIASNRPTAGSPGGHDIYEARRPK